MLSNKKLNKIKGGRKLHKEKKLALIAVLVILISISGSGCIVTGTGTSTDTIYGIEYSGLIFTNYKVWLTHDQGLVGGPNTNKFDGTYTVRNDDTKTIEILKEAKENQKKVKIAYEEHGIGEPWNFHGTTVITNVEYIE